MELIIAAIKAIVIVALILQLIPVLIWFERKGSAYIQDRRGPNRAQILGIRLGGMIHNLADVVKLFCKQDIIPTKASRIIYVVAPMIAIFVASATVGVVPFAEPLHLGGLTIPMQVADLNIGILYILGIGSLGVYGVMLGGWSSNNSYSLLGTLRASAQMVSYEIAMGLALIGLFLVTGTVRITEIVSQQTGFHWYAFTQPIAFVLFLTSLFAETNRNPFDLAEGESELVAGFHTEYSSMKFALFFMAEYAHIAVGSLIVSLLFFGGWNLPGLDFDWIRVYPEAALSMGLPALAVGAIAFGLFLCSKFRRHKYNDARDYEVLIFGVPHVLIGFLMIGATLLLHGTTLPTWVGPVLVAALQMGVVLAKTLFFCAFFIWVRWTLPRFRYDQLMDLGWKGMIPVALFNIVITSAWLVFVH
ncbi:MAG: NADH-quinone oxidoreductase subunit H [Deltaproteobacteria bacterium CG11_big_fil_rev_8_21_14_0_20_47_16]|nr:MAG: NADH-quinone oxidoreductase subunit H [Deltaproteobacteria bacterium CG11_big_fil_rev_8_21_14_0_20_47_16]